MFTMNSESMREGAANAKGDYRDRLQVGEDRSIAAVLDRCDSAGRLHLLCPAVSLLERQGEFLSRLRMDRCAVVLRRHSARRALLYAAWQCGHRRAKEEE